MKINVPKDRRVLVYKKGNLEKMLKPGSHFLTPFSDYSCEEFDVTLPFKPARDLDLYLTHADIASELELFEIKDTEAGLYFKNGNFTDLLPPGRHAFWKAMTRHGVVILDRTSPRLNQKISPLILQNPKVAPFVSAYQVAAHEKGLLFIDGKLEEVLSPGQYFYVRSEIPVELQKVDMRQLQLDMTGQEILTADRVTVRVNFICHYKITDPERVLLSYRNYEEQLYIVLQLILREYVGTLKLDDLLEKKEEIGSFTLAKLREAAGSWGLEFVYAGVKDIILPGDIRDIMNGVIKAEKQAQANVIMRREETASTRSLLNTAKLMEDNPLLLRLKEMEYLERISEKVQSISVHGGDRILEQLRELFVK